MIKFGIYSETQLSNHHNRLTRFSKTEKTISVTLYEAIIDLPDADKLSEQVLYQLSDERGARKRTYSDRFPEFDRFVVELLARELMAGKSLRGNPPIFRRDEK